MHCYHTIFGIYNISRKSLQDFYLLLGCQLSVSFKRWRINYWAVNIAFIHYKRYCSSAGRSQLLGDSGKVNTAESLLRFNLGMKSATTTWTNVLSFLVCALQCRKSLPGGVITSSITQLPQCNIPVGFQCRECKQFKQNLSSVRTKALQQGNSISQVLGE